MAVRAGTVRRLALSLPETAEAPHHDMTSFRVAGKTGEGDDDVLSEMLTDSWRHKAPEKLRGGLHP